MSAVGELCRQHRIGAALGAVLSVLSCGPMWLQHLVVKGCSAPLQEWPSLSPQPQPLAVSLMPEMLRIHLGELQRPQAMN